MMRWRWRWRVHHQLFAGAYEMIAVVGDDVVLVVASRAKAASAELTQHEGVLGEAVHELVVVQVAQALELLAAHLALERRLHVALHVASEPILVVELLVAHGAVQDHVGVRELVRFQLRFGVEAEHAPLALVLAVDEAAYELALLQPLAHRRAARRAAHCRH